MIPSNFGKGTTNLKNCKKFIKNAQNQKIFK